MHTFMLREGEALMAMDDLFSLDLDDPIADWALSPLPLSLLLPTTTPTTAFVPYVPPSDVLKSSPGPNNQFRSSGRNIHRRVVQLLRKQSRGFRHMMRERERRGKLSRSYIDLHSVLPQNSKGDKVSVLQAATAYALQLKEAKEALEKRVEELEAAEGDLGVEVIRVSEVNTSPASVIEGLARLKGMNVKAQSILFCVSNQELSAVVEVQTDVL